MAGEGSWDEAEVAGVAPVAAKAAGRVVVKVAVRVAGAAAVAITRLHPAYLQPPKPSWIVSHRSVVTSAVP